MFNRTKHGNELRVDDMEKNNIVDDIAMNISPTWKITYNVRQSKDKI